MAKRITVISSLIFLFPFLIGSLSEAISPELQQTINEFSLSGYGEEGIKSWEMYGRSANVFSDQIEVNDLKGTIYGEEKIIVTAERGNFNKTQNKVHLEENVVITTESGARLTTDYLDWDKETSQITNDAPVDIRKGDIVTTGVGIQGNTDLKTVNLERDIKLKIDNRRNKIVITCDGPLSVNYDDNVAVFNNNVIVDDGQSQLYADLMEVIFESSTKSNSDSSTRYFAGKSGRIKKIIARGNVKIIRQDNISLSEEAVYNADDKTVILTGRPKLIIYSEPSTDLPE